MKLRYESTLVLLAVIFYRSDLLSQQARPWYQDLPWSPPKTDPKAKILPLIRVGKNKFINSNGEIILFRGVAISDPDKIERQGHWNKAHTAMGIQVGGKIRLC